MEKKKISGIIPGIENIVRGRRLKNDTDVLSIYWHLVSKIIM